MTFVFSKILYPQNAWEGIEILEENLGLEGVKDLAASIVIKVIPLRFLSLKLSPNEERCKKRN